MRYKPDRQECLSYYLVGDVVVVAAGDAVATGDGAAVGVGVAAGTSEGASVCSTERVPVTAGNDSVKAISIKAAAAPIVIFDKTLAVPRGPNAVLETLLEKRSPAPDLPGCSKITTISTTHAKMNNPYKT
ncbi:MAG: hypothetical protein QOD75_4046 [Blastocatellia bacterium]|nr:hypothetical protein [Blastocatellia bacterium]